MAEEKSNIVPHISKTVLIMVVWDVFAYLLMTKEASDKLWHAQSKHFFFFLFLGRRSRDHQRHMHNSLLCMLCAHCYRYAFSADNENTMLLDPVGPHCRNSAPRWQWHLQSQSLLLKELNPDVAPSVNGQDSLLSSGIFQIDTVMLLLWMKPNLASIICQKKPK